jgi:hypothetical protein
MKLNDEDVFIYESDGLGMTLPSHIVVYIAKLEAVVKAARAIFDVEKDYVADCNCTSCKKITGDLEEALDALEE